MKEIAVLLFVVVLMSWFFGKKFVFWFLLLVTMSSFIINIHEIQRILKGEVR